MSELVLCARQDCGKMFQKKKHNQKYCNDECCRLATNANIMKRYYADRARKMGAVRFCDVCGIKLSRYNETDTCSGCSSHNTAGILSTIKKTLGDVIVAAE